MYRPIARLPRSVARVVILAIALIASSMSAEPAAEPASADSATEGPSLDVAPSSIEAHAVSNGEPFRVQVRLTAGGRQLTGITISSFSNDGVDASVEGAANIDKLPPKAEHVWMLRLLPRGGTRAPTDLAVNVTVAFQVGEQAWQRYLFQTVTIKAAPASGDPTLSVEPSTIEGQGVSTAEPNHVQVRLKAGNDDLTDVVLSASSNDDIATKVGSAAKVAKLAANTEHVWTMELAPGKGAALPLAAASVGVGVAFREGAEGRQRYLFQTLKIAAPSAAVVPALADVDIKGSLEALSHERPGQIFIVVTNKYSRALQIRDATLYGPKFIAIRGPGAKEFRDPAVSRVAYGASKVLSYDVTAADQLVPGKYSIVVVLSSTAEDGVSGSVVKSQDIDLAVLGESDLLSKLGAPSLLFLPGVLFLLAWQLLWSFGKTKEQRDAYEMTPTSGAFWLFAVVISFFSAFAYPWLVWIVFHMHRDYVVAYGLIDYLYVFAFAIVTACVAFVAWLGLQGWAAWYRRRQTAANTPSETDDVLAILTKLGRLGQAIVFNQAHAAAGRPEDLVFVLNQWREPAFLWVVPPAQLRASAAATRDDLNFVQLIASGEITDARTLADRLGKGMNRSWTLDWRPVGALSRPRKGPVGDWTPVNGEGRLIDVD